ncbi:putative ion channel POLLUX [Hibiscus syriacus]|uniref:Ion channel POLLUX n=1 Tax=Hibiscus syriacus TaxID=106335 RepID=A0A6A3AUR7_HIBSY|nr:putative ion channel POLLUX [Hibiscus syriacus]
MPSNGGSGESTSTRSPQNPSSRKADRPPVLKKFKTVESDDPRPTTTFPGPLFPAVRRVTLSSDRRSSVDTNASSDKLSSEVNVASGSPNNVNNVGVVNSMSDRDWMYPSFLGVHAARNRVVTIKPASRPPVRGSGERLAERIQGKVVDEKQQSNTPSNKEEVKIVSSTTTERSSVSSSSSRRIRGMKLKRYFNFFLIILSCIYPLTYVNHLRNKVARLEVENINLLRWCSETDVVGNNGNEFLPPEDDSSYKLFGNADSKTVALYTVMFTLMLPFVLYKCLDYIPQIKIISKRTMSNKEEVLLKKRIAYMVDVCFSVYPYAKLLALLFATIFLIAFGGLALYAVTVESLTEALWLSWTFVADSGNHADSVGIGPRIVSVSISSGGMLIFAMMLGLVSDAISEKVDSLRKGKSEVIEKNHTLILGWNDKLGSLLKQLAIANKSVGGGVVVVLAERDKEEMEIDIAKLEFDFMGTSVICRSGSPLILADLKKVSVSKARAIIVLASDENADQSDARALRVVLSLTGVKEGLKGHVVVEMSDLDNEPLVKLVGGDLIETVVAHDVIGLLMIQCALQPGLAQIWEDILGFENDEFYIKRWPQMDGMQFEDVLISFPDAIPSGVKVAADNGKIIINPDDNYVLKEGDEVLVIAEDDDTYSPCPLPQDLLMVRRVSFPEVPELPKYPERILFCGWRRDIHDMIMKKKERKLIDGGLDISGLENIKLVHREGNAVIRRHLESLPLETFDSVSCYILSPDSPSFSRRNSEKPLISAPGPHSSIQSLAPISKRLPYKDRKSTSLRLAGFSHSSWICEMQQASDKSIIISEILDSRTGNLVSVSRISDYVLSDELVSMALAMVAEDKQINRVLEGLFAEEGNEMCIKPAEFYLFDQEELCFYEIMIRSRRRKEIVIGYRLANSERAVINPPRKLEENGLLMMFL